VIGRVIVRDGSPNGGARRDESLRAAPGSGKTSMERTPRADFAPDRGHPPGASRNYRR
jgi:hypothetical protein